MTPDFRIKRGRVFLQGFPLLAVILWVFGGFSGFSRFFKAKWYFG